MAWHHTYQTKGHNVHANAFIESKLRGNLLPTLLVTYIPYLGFDAGENSRWKPMNRFLRFVGRRRPANHRKVSHVFSFVNVSAAAGRVILIVLIRFTASSASLNIQWYTVCVFLTSLSLSLFSAKSQAIIGHNAFPSRIAKEYWHFLQKPRCIKNKGVTLEPVWLDLPSSSLTTWQQVIIYTPIALVEYSHLYIISWYISWYIVL